MRAFKPANPLIATQDDNRPLDTLKGTIERITFHNEDNGYTVAKVMPPNARDVVTVLGNFSNPVVGESLICHGHWSTHTQFGRQMQVVKYEVVRPATAYAVEKYLGSGMIKGVGPVMAKRIVAKFGAEALDVIEEHPERLKEVSGIGGKRITQIAKAWVDQREVKNIMVFLQSHGVSPAYAIRVYKTYGGRAIEVVEKNPYQLATDVWGIGFKTADHIASEMGIGEDDPRRIESGLIYVLNQAVETGGNAYLTVDELLEKSHEILGEGDFRDTVEKLSAEGRMVSEPYAVVGEPEIAVYPPSLHTTERGLAGRLIKLINIPIKQPASQAKFDHWLGEVLRLGSAPLSEEQNTAVRSALLSRVLVLTGGPGTGKTTTTRAIVAAFEALNKNIVLCSPTGRAAKRLSEVTGREARTIHRLLEFDPSQHGFKRGLDNPLDCDVLVVDEASMLDMVISYSLIKALPETAQLIFVGDIDQLPSVGPGNVLRDLINSGTIPVARLTQIFRQAAESLIITNAHSINAGRVPDLPPPSANRDCAFLAVEEAEELADKVVAVVARSLPKRGFRPQDIQVLTPMQRGSAGAANLNARLQEVLNPPMPGKDEISRAGRLFRAGDRVMQTVNNYDKIVFNGDIGTVLRFSYEESMMFVDFSGNVVTYEFNELDELTLAFACTIHKSQGSEYPAVVIALHTQHFVLLQRNLLYTALTRAQKFAVVIGSIRAVAIAVKKQNDIDRHTRLRDRLQGLL